MGNQSRTMLESLYAAIYQKFRDPTKAWESFIEFLAVDHCAPLIAQKDYNFDWLFKDNGLVITLSKIYNPEVLKSDYRELLDEMYQGIFLKRGDNLKPLKSDKFSSPNLKDPTDIFIK